MRPSVKAIQLIPAMGTYKCSNSCLKDEQFLRFFLPDRLMPTPAISPARLMLPTAILCVHFVSRIWPSLLRTSSTQPLYALLNLSLLSIPSKVINSRRSIREYFWGGSCISLYPLKGHSDGWLTTPSDHISVDINHTTDEMIVILHCCRMIPILPKCALSFLS